MKNIALKHLIIFIAIAALISAAVTTLNTNYGLHTCINMASLLAPGNLQIENSRGRILGPIKIEKLKYENKKFQLTIDNLYLDWSIAEFLFGKTTGLVIKGQNLNLNFSGPSTLTNYKINPIDTALKLVAKLKSCDIELEHINLQNQTTNIIKINSINIHLTPATDDYTAITGDITTQESSLTIKGTLKNQYNIDWAFNSKNLEELLTNAKGKAKWSGKITGTPDNATIDNSLWIDNFRYNDLSFKSLIAKSVIQTQANKKSDCSLEISSPTFGQLTFNKLNLSGNWQEDLNNTKNTIINIIVNPTSVAFPINADIQHLQLEKITFQGKYNERQPDTIKHQTILRAGNGTLNLSGDISFINGNLSTNTSITGSNFLLLNTHEYKIIASPEINITTKNDLINITGKAIVSEATIKPSGFSSDNLLPDEVVYVQKPKIQSKSYLNWSIDILLELGNNILIDIMHLKGKLTGSLRLVDETSKPTKTFGSLQLKDASYLMYGQQLKVTHADLHFFGSSIDNPEVNIEAIRELGTSSQNGAKFSDATNKKITVGLRVIGVLNRAKIELFSIPSDLSKPDILSYIITGQPSKQAAENKAMLLLHAASALDLGGSSDITNFTDKLRKKLNFTEIGIAEETRSPAPQDAIMSNLDKNSAGAAPKTSTTFVIGKYITPKIYLGYSIGLLDPINTFRAKYHMGHYWAIQTQTSTAGSGADLIYSIERD